MKFLSFAVLFLFFSSYAAADVVINPQSGKIILSSSACKEATVLVQEFSNPQCGKKKSSGWFSGQCEFDISLCLADVYRELHGVKALVNGLNSWNLALFAAGVQPVLRYASAKEFQFYLKSPLCRQLKTDESLAAKDLLVVRDKEGDEVQASSVVTENLVFVKMSEKTLEPYYLQRKSEFASRFKVNPEENHFESFRCENFEKFLERQKDLPADLREAHRELTVIEKNIAHILPVKVALTLKDSEKLKTQIQKVLSSYKTMNTEKNASETFVFFREAIKQRLMGISEHLKENAKSVATSELEIKRPLIDQIDTALGLVPRADKTQEFDPNQK